MPRLACARRLPITPVTAEKRSAGRDRHGAAFTVIDLPGAYSLDAKSPDEEVTRAVLRGERPTRRPMQ